MANSEINYICCRWIFITLGSVMAGFDCILKFQQRFKEMYQNFFLVTTNRKYLDSTISFRGQRPQGE